MLFSAIYFKKKENLGLTLKKEPSGFCHVMVTKFVARIAAIKMVVGLIVLALLRLRYTSVYNNRHRGASPLISN